MPVQSKQDPIWELVKESDTGNMRCTYCNIDFGKWRRTDRAYQHFGLKREGQKFEVRVCKGPPTGTNDENEESRIAKKDAWEEAVRMLEKDFESKEQARKNDEISRIAKWEHTSNAAIMLKGTQASIVTPPKRDNSGNFLTSWNDSIASAMARAFYSTGIAPNVLADENMVTFLAHISGGDFKPPSAYQLLGSLLDKEYNSCKTQMAAAYYMHLSKG